MEALTQREDSAADRVRQLTHQVRAAFEGVRDYTCRVEQIYFRDGLEEERYRFKYYFKREKRIRLDFDHPYPGLTLYYLEGTGEATVVPFRFLPILRFRYPIGDPAIMTPTGQRIDQTDIGYFVDFLVRNLAEGSGGPPEIREDELRVEFSLSAKDYLAGDRSENYRIVVAKDLWLPVRIERFTRDGQPVEVSIIRDYVINGNLEEDIFLP
jgi:outer membrane lipoprotein-sorting protein